VPTGGSLGRPKFPPKIKNGGLPNPEIRPCVRKRSGGTYGAGKKPLELDPKQENINKMAEKLKEQEKK
jgi:hypothetical protein